MMELTKKVSIGGLPFLLKEDAYEAIEKYLQSLKKHFSGKPDADEIVTDIEERIGELLQMRCNANTEPINLSDMQEVIHTMGNPQNFEGDDKKSDDASTGKDCAGLSLKKKLYRDVNNKLLGGVCSGLGHYFRIDPVVIRLLFMFPFLLFVFFQLFYLPFLSPFCEKIFALWTIIYILLWIIIPKVKNPTQKPAEKDPDPSIDNIQSAPPHATKKYRGGIVRKIIRALYNIVVVSMFVVSILILLATTVSFIFLLVNQDLFGIDDFLSAQGVENIRPLIISVFIFLTLPVMGVAHLLLKMFKRRWFTAVDWVIAIIALTVLIGDAAYLFNKTKSFVDKRFYVSADRQTVMMKSTSGVLYVDIDAKYLNVENVLNTDKFFLLEGDTNKHSLFILPDILTCTDNSTTAFKVEVNKVCHGKTRFNAQEKAKNTTLDYLLTDSVLTIKPQLYNKHNIWTGDYLSLKIYAPAGKEIVIKDRFKDLFPQRYFRDKCDGSKNS